MSSVAERLDLNGTVDTLMSGDLFSGLLLDDAERRAVALEALLGKVVDDDTRLVWVGNPLRSPLTIERFLIQIAGPEIDLCEERGPKELAQLVSKQVKTETRLLVVVQQPETISADTIHLLVQMGWYSSADAVQVQYLFVGSSTFVVPRLAEPSAIMLASQREPAEAAGNETTTGPRRRDVIPLVLLLVAVTVGAVFSMAPVSHSGLSLATPGSTDAPSRDRAIPPEAEEPRPSPAVRSTQAAGAADRNPAAACP